MQKRILTAIFLICCILLGGAFPLLASGADSGQIIKVGLIYGDSRGSSVNVFHDGGYYFGYYDESGAFALVAPSDGRFISVVTDATFRFKDSVLYESGAPEGSVNVGAYHVYSQKSFSSYADAAGYLGALQSAGLPDPFISYENGEYKIKIDCFSKLEYAQEAAAGMSYPDDNFTAGGGNQNTCTVVDMNSGKIIFEYTGASGVNFAVRARQAGDTKTYLKNKNSLYYGDFVFVRSGSQISLINYVPIDDYVKGVLPYEMSSSWPIEALKAQAVCARNFALTNISRHKSDGFSLCTGEHCQVYAGAGRETDSVLRAAAETAGIVAVYSGKVAELYYHSSSGGYTEDVRNVWGGTVPYLLAVSSPEDLDSAFNGVWTYTVSASELTNHFNNKGYNLGNIKNIYVDEFTAAGNVLSVTVEGDRDTVKIQKEQARIRLSPYVKSQRFTVYPQGQALGVYDAKKNLITSAFGELTVRTGKGQENLPSEPSVLTKEGVKPLTRQTVGTGTSSGSEAVFVFDGRGWGNNIGMSQYGAKKMAEEGKTYEEILLHYFPGTTLEIR